MGQGFSRHAARGAVATLLIPHFYEAVHDKKPFDREGYARRLRVLGTVKKEPGRNEPCFCSSGWKYEQCCGPLGRIMTPSKFPGRLILGYGEYAAPEVLIELPADDLLLQMENRVHIATFLGRNGLAEATWKVLAENLALAKKETGRPLYSKAARDEFYESVRQLIDGIDALSGQSGFSPTGVQTSERFRRGCWRRVNPGRRR